MKFSIQPYIDKITEFFTNIDIYIEASAILIIIAIASLAAQICKKRLKLRNKKSTKINKIDKYWVIRALSKFIFPIITILLLFLSKNILDQLLEYNILINAAIRVSYIWILWIAIRAFVINPFIKTVSLWFLVPAAFLQLFGVFQITVGHLNSYGFSLGEINITAYTIIKAIFFISVIFWFGSVLEKFGQSYILNKRSLNRSTQELLIKIFQIFLYFILFMFMLNLIGINLQALAVLGGAIGVGIGFGLQKIASNFISGIILLSERNININDLIEMDGGVYGYVRKFGARSSIIEMFDGKEVIVPNEDFITSKVSNLTYSQNFSRIDVNIGVAYATDLDKAKHIILEAAKEFELTSKSENHQPQCHLREFGNSSINFLLTFWIEDVTTGRWCAQSEVMFSVWRKFKENSIEIPFPQHDLHLKTVDAEIMFKNNQKKEETEN